MGPYKCEMEHTDTHSQLGTQNCYQTSPEWSSEEDPRSRDGSSSTLLLFATLFSCLTVSSLTSSSRANNSSSSCKVSSIGLSQIFVGVSARSRTLERDRQGSREKMKRMAGKKRCREERILV